jgi:hypothetical protein
MTRSCGDCSACCTTHSVAELKKPERAVIAPSALDPVAQENARLLAEREGKAAEAAWLRRYGGMT